MYEGRRSGLKSRKSGVKYSKPLFSTSWNALTFKGEREEWARIEIISFPFVVVQLITLFLQIILFLALK
jgi:hypothetical protein